MIRLIKASHVSGIYCTLDKNPPFCSGFLAVLIVLIKGASDLMGIYGGILDPRCVQGRSAVHPSPRQVPLRHRLDVLDPQVRRTAAYYVHTAPPPALQAAAAPLRAGQTTWQSGTPRWARCRRHPPLGNGDCFKLRKLPFFVSL
jgi:hypothetical protein